MEIIEFFPRDHPFKTSPNFSRFLIPTSLLSAVFFYYPSANLANLWNSRRLKWMVPSVKIQMVGGKITEIWGSNPRSRRSKEILSFFCSFSIIKLHIFVFSHFQHVLFDFLITKQDNEKCLKAKIPNFVWRIWKWNESWLISNLFFSICLMWSQKNCFTNL